MTEVDLDKLEALEKAATPDPWELQTEREMGDYGSVIGEYLTGIGTRLCEVVVYNDDYGNQVVHNAQLIVTLRNAAPTLLAEVRLLRERNQRLRGSLREMLIEYEWTGYETGWRKRLHDEARAALANEGVEEPAHV